MTSPSDRIPFPFVVGELERLFAGAGLVYAVVGGVAVARNSSFRTTGDVDVLLRREEWRRFHGAPGNEVGEAERGRAGAGVSGFRFGPDWAQHLETGVTVDLLFAGDDWDLPLPLPDPGGVREWDTDLGAWFITARELLQLKAAVHLAKLAEFGDAVAAKDLGDVTALLEANAELRSDETLRALDPAVRPTIERVLEQLDRLRRRPPKGRR